MYSRGQDFRYSNQKETADLDDMQKMLQDLKEQICDQIGL